MKVIKSNLYIIDFKYLLLMVVCLLSCKENGIQPEVREQKEKLRSAVVLTYDDALDVHLDNVIPLLDSLDLKATFYLNTGAESVLTRRAEWKEAAANGHELGNHTIHHPCIGESLNREWVTRENDLDYYTLDKLIEEIKVANDTLQSMDGLQRRTYAYTCGDTTANHRSYVSQLAKIFPSARGVNRDNNDLDSMDLYQINAFSINGHKFNELQKVIEDNHEEEGLLVFLLHGVGGGHGLNIELEEHTKLIEYLHSRKESIMITNMLDMTDFVKEMEQ